MTTEKRSCDGEIGKPGQTWHRCGKPASWESREKRYSVGTLYFCDAHKGHGEDPTYVQTANRYTVAVKP